MNFLPYKTILIVMVTFFAVFQSAISDGQVLGSNLRGQWAGKGLLHAKADGFIPSKDSIKMHINQQDGLTFTGRIERSYHGNIILQDVEGYLDNTMHNICFIDQKNRNIIIGYVASNAIMKLYCWDDNGINETTVYILRKTVTVPN